MKVFGVSDRYKNTTLLQSETEQNVLFVDAFTLNCFLTDFHGGYNA